MKIIFDIIQNISIIVASAVAVWGINSWRRETKWKRKYELAEEVLSLFYECREKFQVIRSPLGYAGEGKTRKRNDHETPEETERLDNAYVFFERYEKEKEPFNRLSALKFRFMTLYGKESSEPFDQIRKILNTIFFAANRLAETYWKNQGSGIFKQNEEYFKRHLEEMHKNEAIVWAQYDEQDKIAQQINACVTKIENYCSSIIQNKPLPTFNVARQKFET
jgi:hypothetical protein